MLNRREFVSTVSGTIFAPAIFSATNIEKSILHEITPLAKYKEERKDSYLRSKKWIDTLDINLAEFLASDNKNILIDISPPKAGRTTVYQKYFTKYLDEHRPEIKWALINDIPKEKLFHTGSPLTGKYYDLIILEDIIKNEESIDTKEKINKFIDYVDCLRCRCKKLIIAGNALSQIFCKYLQRAEVQGKNNTIFIGTPITEFKYTYNNELNGKQYFNKFYKLGLKEQLVIK